MSEELPGKGIVFKDSDWELQMFLVEDDGYTPLEGLPPIPIGDSEDGITKDISEYNFYFVKWKPLKNEIIETMLKKAKETNTKINGYELLCKHDYLLSYSTLKFEFKDKVIESIERGDFWDSVMYIYQNETIEF